MARTKQTARGNRGKGGSGRGRGGDRKAADDGKKAKVTACKSKDENRPELVKGSRRKAAKPMRWDARALKEIRKEQRSTKLCIPKAPLAR